ncbi:MAG: RNA polymerase sigma factor [Gemmatimonadaceae bacterium]
MLRRSADAQPRAFEELVSAHLDALYRTALRLCAGRTPDAEDLLQDAMLRAFEGFGELRDPDAGRSWLFTILVRANLNRVRLVKRRAEDLTADLDDTAFEAALAAWTPAVATDERMDHKYLQEAVGEALNALEPDLRVVVCLTDLEELSQRETAAILGVPEGTVASRLFRARRALRDALRREAHVGRLQWGGGRGRET